MKKSHLLKVLGITILLLFGFTALIMADGSVTQTYTSVGHEVAKLTFAWTGDASDGTVPATQSTADIDGYVFQVITDPGTPAPTDDYDITLTDEGGNDIMGAELANRDTANTESAVPLIATSTYGKRFVDGKVTLNVSNQSVTGAQAEVKIYYYRYIHTR